MLRTIAKMLQLQHNYFLWLMTHRKVLRLSPSTSSSLYLIYTLKWPHNAHKLIVFYLAATGDAMSLAIVEPNPDFDAPSDDQPRKASQTTTLSLMTTPWLYSFTCKKKNLERDEKELSGSFTNKEEEVRDKE